MKRVTSRDAKGAGRSMGRKEVKAESGSLSDPLIGEYEVMKTPTKKKNHVEKLIRKSEKIGGSVFWRMMNRNKKPNTVTTNCKRSPPMLTNPERRLVSSTPVTIDTDTGSEIEVPLSIPCERMPSFAETTFTQEVSDFSVQANEACKKHDTKESSKRSSGTRPSPRALVFETSAVQFRNARSLRSVRKSGNESLGESKPDQPRRGFLPPLLANDEEESIGESSCSGITMDFTYGEEMRVPIRQPVGRLGEGVRQYAPRSFVPPSYITMDDRDEMDEEDLYSPSYRGF